MNVGDGAPTTKEFVTGFDTDTIPVALTLVFGVAAGTVGEVIVKFG